MRLFTHKKGLELPITAIVVLIISITFLGLAIFFIKSLFTGGTELLAGELAKIKDQLRKNLEESGELFIMSEGTEIEVRKGEPKKFFVGIRNTAPQKVCFRIAIHCLKPFTPDNECSFASPNTPVLVGGVDADGNTRPSTGDNWFPRILSELDIPGGDVEVSPVTLQISGAVRPDTYLVQADIYKENNNKDCVQGGDFPENFPNGEAYQSKRFHIIVTS